ncbi:Skp1 family, dimerization domain-containing protein [Suillus spraguei]|nr:Skp1 family, dimerization domain-containing protein [Suillus spraguei]
MVRLVTSDNVEFVVDKEVVERSALLRDFISEGESVPLANVSSTVLSKVIEYCEHHRRTTDIGEWDQEFMTVDHKMLFDIIIAANYLNIKSLLELGCKVVANLIKGKTPDEIRRLFNQ